jgi:hypothetical protein
MENETKKVGIRMAAGFLIAITIIVAVLASGITLPSQVIKTGRLTVLIKDAPVDLDHLIITISELEGHKVGTEENSDGEWISLLESGDTIPDFDLLAYQSDNTLELTSIDIPAGSYNKIRLYVSSAYADYSEDSEREDGPVNVPSHKIDVIAKFELKEGGTRIVTIDMEPDWVAISKSNNLRPTLKASVSEQAA